VIDVALLSVIRRWQLSRNTVRKYLATDIVEPKYPKRKTPSKLDDYEHTLTSWLFRETKRHRKYRRCVKQLFRDLVDLGFTGSYDRVAAFARVWREGQKEAARTASKNTFVPLQFAPGEAFQFDWSEDWVVIDGVSTKLQVAHFKLCYSRAFFLRAYLLQTHEMLFDAHYHALSTLGGIPERGIYDNMKTAVDKVLRGKARQVNKRFQAMVSHYLFEAEFCNPAAGWEKGQVEKGVQDARSRLWQGAPAFKTLADLNAWLLHRSQALWLELEHPEYKGRSIADVWQEEQEHLMPMPFAFDGFVEQAKRVTSTCLITFDHNRYSVPASFANRVISLRIYADRLVVVAEAEIITEHERVFSRDHRAPGKTVYDWRHYLAVAQRKPGALRNGAPFKTLPDSFQQLQKQLLRHPGGDREMVNILALVLLHDESLVEQAIEMALQSGQASKEHVLNCLSRLSDQPAPAALKPPAKLALVNEPKADTARYDHLREVRHGR
jgi:transposase